MNAATLKQAYAEGCRDFCAANLRGANLRAAHLREANLRGADLQGANLRGADLQGTDLSWADLQGTDLSWADLQGADLSWANLRGANLRGANLPGAGLRRAILAQADLREANLREANLREANLRGAYLRGADLRGAGLCDAFGADELPRQHVPGLARRVLEQITTHPDTWDQEVWHSECGTKHCVAGWAVKLAPGGEAAEHRLGTAHAAVLLLGGDDHPFGAEDDPLPWLARRAELEGVA